MSTYVLCMCTCPSKYLILWTCTWLCQYWLDGGIYIYTPPPPVHTHVHKLAPIHTCTHTSTTYTPAAWFSYTCTQALPSRPLALARTQMCRITTRRRLRQACRGLVKVGASVKCLHVISVCCSVLQCGAVWCSGLVCWVSLYYMRVSMLYECLHIISYYTTLYECLHIIWVPQYYMSVSILYECLHIIWVLQYYMSVSILHECLHIISYYMSVSIWYECLSISLSILRVYSYHVIHV